MNLEKDNIKHVAGTRFYVNKKSPTKVSYRVPVNPNEWKEIKLEFIDVREPDDDEILYYYNDISGYLLNINELEND